jgi:hypothetical protein
MKGPDEVLSCLHSWMKKKMRADPSGKTFIFWADGACLIVHLRLVKMSEPGRRVSSFVVPACTCARGWKH